MCAREKREMTLNESISRVDGNRSGVFLIGPSSRGTLLHLNNFDERILISLLLVRFLAIDKSEILKSHRNNYSVQQQHFLRHVNYASDPQLLRTHTYRMRRSGFLFTRRTNHFIGSTLRDATTLQMSSTYTRPVHKLRVQISNPLLRCMYMLFLQWLMCSVWHLI